MITRNYVQVKLPPQPGLSLSLQPSLSRPIHRLLPQLKSELALLHRFTYKNKNQHKANAWWRGTIEADRVLARVLDELNGLMSGLGGGAAADGVETKKGKGSVAGSSERDGKFSVTHEEILNAVLRAPRAMLLVDHALQTLLHTASLLNQLVESRAFLPFSLTLISVISRLHALLHGGKDDLSKLAHGLMRVAVNGNLEGALRPLVQRLPKPLRPYVRLSPPSPICAPPPPPFKVTTLSSSSSPALGNDDLGALVERTPALPLPPLPPPPPPPPQLHRSTPSASPPVSPIALEEAEKSAEKSINVPVKRKTGEAKKVKKKKRKLGGDEIDDIFG